MRQIKVLNTQYEDDMDKTWRMVRRFGDDIQVLNLLRLGKWNCKENSKFKKRTDSL